jgi:hypothetical protein
VLPTADATARDREIAYSAVQPPSIDKIRAGDLRGIVAALEQRQWCCRISISPGIGELNKITTGFRCAHETFLFLLMRCE